MNKENQENKMLQELSNRKAALNKKHEMEQNALKARQDRESKALEVRYAQWTGTITKDGIIH
mgnify:FL=1|jgi:hypothetical protein